MHWTLHPTKSLLLAVLCACIAGVVAWFARPFPLVQLAIAAPTGVAIGLLQARALRESPAAFRAARTAMDVRSALSGTKAGGNAIRLQWASFGLLVAVSVGHALIQDQESHGSPALGAFVGYLALAFFRDLAALPAVRDLARAPGVA